MGMITLVEVQDTLFTVLTDEDCYYLAIAMKHRALLGNRPMTVAEHWRIADLFKTHKDDGMPLDFDDSCKCAIHTSTTLSPSFSELLKRIMAISAELNVDFLSGNLGNLAVQVLEFIIQKAGLSAIQICKEDKSRAGHAGSKSVFTMGYGDKYMTVEATPDFYVRKTSPIIYILLGESESSGSSDPEVQAMLAAVGVLARRATTKIGALLHQELRCQLFLGSCHWKTPLSTYGTVSFKKVNTSTGFFLDNKDDLELDCGGSDKGSTEQ